MLTRQQSLAGCARVSACSHLPDFWGGYWRSFLSQRSLRQGHKVGVRDGTLKLEKLPMGRTAWVTRPKHLQLMQSVSQSVIHHSAVSGRHAVSRGQWEVGHKLTLSCLVLETARSSNSFAPAMSKGERLFQLLLSHVAFQQRAAKKM